VANYPAASNEAPADVALIEEVGPEKPTVLSNEEHSIDESTGRLTLDKDHCLIKRGAWYGIFNLKEGGEPRLISKDKAVAVAALAGYSHVKEFCSWSASRSRGDE
jgi:hypothetical protein